MADTICRDGAPRYSRPIARAVLRDNRLSFGARGLFSFLSDLPAGWQLNVAHLARMGPEGIDAIRSRLKELRAVGAIYIETIRQDDGKVAGKRWVVVDPENWAIESSLSARSDTPVEEGQVSDNRDIPMPGNPRLENPQVEKPSSKVPLSNASSNFEAPRDFSQGKNAASSNIRYLKARRERRSGIVTWCESDEIEALRLEKTHSPELLAAAIALSKSEGSSPVPGTVEHCIQKILSAQKGEDTNRAARQESERRFREEMIADPEAVVAGKRLLHSRNRKKEG